MWDWRRRNTLFIEFYLNIEGYKLAIVVGWSTSISSFI